MTHGKAGQASRRWRRRPPPVPLAARGGATPGYDVPSRGRAPRPPARDDVPDLPEPTARPSDRPELEEDDGDRLVPLANVGGAAPTVLGGDSGGDFPGPEDDLANLAEPEPPESPEVDAVHVRRGEGPRPPRR